MKQMGATFHNFGGLQPMSIMQATTSGIKGHNTEKDWCNNSTMIVQKGVPAPTFSRSAKSKDASRKSGPSKLTTQLQDPTIFDRKRHDSQQAFRLK
jgi:hypothetical protein